MTDFPNDADGDALRRVAEHADMSKPMSIDFMIDVPNEHSGNEVARVAGLRGYKTSLEFDEDGQRWTCYCTKSMMLTYDAVIEAQRELDGLSEPFGGHSDGWGTPGN